MKSKIYTITLMILFSAAMTGTAYMAYITNNTINDLKQLDKDYQELQQDYLDVKLHRDSLIDQIWMESQEQMKGEEEQ